MKKSFSATLAGNILVVTLISFLVFHFLILFQVVPANIIWGGQVKDDLSNLVQLETVAILFLSIFLFITITKIKLLNAGKINRSINFGIWAVFAYMILNTLGNIASGVAAEAWIFTPITILMAICAYRLAIEK